MQILRRLRNQFTSTELYEFLNDLRRTINGGLELGTINDPTINIKGKVFSGATPGVANTEFTITHNFGYVPTGILTLSVDQAAIIYKGATSWTSTQISLKCSQATVNYTLFVL